MGPRARAGRNVSAPTITIVPIRMKMNITCPSACALNRTGYLYYNKLEDNDVVVGVILLILIVIWAFMLILAEWKNDPFYGIVCGVIGFVIIPSFWYAVPDLVAVVAFGAVWGFLNGYILIMNLAQAVNVAAGRDSNKPK